MKNFTNSKIKELENAYANTDRYFCLNILKHFSTIASSNNGILPNHFNLKIYVPDLNLIKEVLEDLGYPHIRNIMHVDNEIYITLC